MGGVCGTYGEKEKYCFLIRKLEGNVGHLEEPDVDGRIILKKRL
jgi:hypothetical protein